MENIMKKGKKLVTLGVCTLLLCGCGSIPTLSDGSQAVISFKEGTDGISANQLYEAMKENYALETIIDIMDKQLLEKKYEGDLEEAKKNADTTVKSMKDAYGEEQIISYFGSLDRYKETLYISNLRNKAIEDYAKSLVTDAEIQSYYDKNIYPDIVIDHILVKTGVSDDTSEEEKAKLEEAAKKKINEVIEKLNKAENKLETFKELALQYSEDDATKDIGGSLGAVNTGTLTSSYDEILKSARSLKDGEYSKSIITTDLGYHVIFRESAKEKASLDDKRSEITDTLGTQKLEEDATIRVTALDEMRKEYGMNIEDSDIKTKYSNYIANQIAQARNTSN